jgi:hypothetical protein
MINPTVHIGKFVVILSASMIMAAFIHGAIRTVFGMGMLVGMGCPSFFPFLVEENAKFTLPPSAHNIISACGGMQGWMAQARFEMSPDDLDNLLASTFLTQPLTEIAPEERLDDVENMSSYLYGRSTSGLWQEIIINTSDPNVYTVYITTIGGN